MPLHQGFRLGPYEIQSSVGAGGMGEVYQALDTRLDRIVAIKILSGALAEDPEFRERFDREARAISRLTHPHICMLYDVGHQDGAAFLVMEYLEGETLATRLANGPLPLGAALRVAIEIAGALDTAHRAGIVHRDLKPGNIFLTKSGAKLLDFGLAKSGVKALGSGMTGPTTPANLTAQGTILGTFQYMAPEQLEAREADPRADIFAFGSVLYEMITGRKAFEGQSQASVMAAILERQPPPMSTLQQLTPPALDHIVGRCLVKDPDGRWQTARDLEEELRWVSGGGGVAPAVSGQARRLGRERLAWGVLAIALLGVAAWAIQRATRVGEPLPEPAVMRFEIPTPPTSEPMSFAVSPDGRQLTFVATAEGVSRLWVRPLAQATALPLAGTDGASFPFWSPDSQSIGFFADAKLKRIDISGGPAQTLADAIIARGGTWNREGIILFAPVAGAIFRVPASGGEPIAVTKIARPHQANHRFPSFLPDGRHFLFFVQGSLEGRGVYLGSLDGAETHRLIDADEAAAMAADGRVLFVRARTLFAQALDVDRGVLHGDPVPVADQLTVDNGLNVAAFAASAAGPIAYRAGTGYGERRLAWFDRSGHETSAVGAEGLGVPSNPELSPDGQSVALDGVVNGNRDIWLVEMVRGGRRRFTFDPAVDFDAIWSPDGQRIVFASNRNGVFDLYEKPSSGAGSEKALLISPQHKRPLEFSPDGHYVLYREFNPDTSWDLVALPLSGGGKPLPVIQTRFEEREGQFSRDGKWVAYQSNETGRFEIYVQPFLGSGGKRQVSVTGGVNPRWQRDGKELCYIGLDGKIMVAAIHLGKDGEVIDADTPAALFSTRLAEGPSPTNNNKHQYAVAPDGRRFLMNVSVEGSTGPPITMLFNWDAAMRK